MARGLEHLQRTYQCINSMSDIVNREMQLIARRDLRNLCHRCKPRLSPLRPVPARQILVDDLVLTLLLYHQRTQARPLATCSLKERTAPGPHSAGYSVTAGIERTIV